MFGCYGNQRTFVCGCCVLHRLSDSHLVEGGGGRGAVCHVLAFVPDEEFGTDLQVSK